MKCQNQENTKKKNRKIVKSLKIKKALKSLVGIR